MFLGVSHGACVPNGAALRTSTEAGSFVEVKGWSGPAANLLQRDSFAHVRTCAKPSFTVTSGPHHIGGTTIGGMTDQHIPTARDRSILQGWPSDDPMVFPPGNTETDNRVLVADLIPPPFATVLAAGDVFRTLVKAGKIWHLRIQISTVQHADSQLWTEEKLQQQVLLINDGVIGRGSDEANRRNSTNT